MTVYDNVKSECDMRKWSINLLESKAHLPQGTVRKWKECVPNLANIKRVADALSVSVDWLIKDCEVYKKDESN